MKMHAPLLPLAVAMMAGIAMSPWVNDWLLPLCLLAVVVIATFFTGRYPRLQTHRFPLPLVAVGIHLAGKAVALHVLQVVEMSLVVFVNLLDTCVQQKAVAYLYLFTVPVALHAAA